MLIGMTGAGDLETKLGALLRFMDSAPLTTTIAGLEHALDGRKRSDVKHVLVDQGLSAEVLQAGLFARQRMGRLNDVIHAVAIALSLPRLLEPDEKLRRPSLAAGNDPSRPFDVETDRRIAEFKLARWDGHDAMRKRQLFKDLVHLAADRSGRYAELYVLGERPWRFLDSTQSKAAWALDRTPATRELFESRFGDLNVSIPDFRHGFAAQVQVIDLEHRFPELFGASPQ